MIFYDLLSFYTSLSQKRNQILKEISSIRYTNLLRRKRRNTVRFYYVLGVKSKRKTVSISREEYARMYADNVKYNRLRTALTEVNIVLRFFDKRIDRYRIKLNSEYEHLSFAASLTGPNKTSSFLTSSKIYHTKRGDKVRSKSEQSIADALYDNGVDYEYESESCNLRYVPDFIIHDSVRGKTVIWEHFGMMSDPAYVAKTLEKIKYYESRGYVLGDNFIATFELYIPSDTDDDTAEHTDSLKFDSETANRIVRRLFTPYVFPCTA